MSRRSRWPVGLGALGLVLQAFGTGREELHLRRVNGHAVDAPADDLAAVARLPRRFAEVRTFWEPISHR